MEALLGIIVILSPVFTIVCVWNDLGKKMWAKVVNTCIMALMIIVCIGFGSNYNKLEDANKTIAYASKINLGYIDCLDYNNSTFDKMFDNCIMPNVKLLRNIYNR